MRFLGTVWLSHARRPCSVTLLFAFSGQDSIGGNSKTFIVANVSPADDCMGETLSALKFAQRAKMVKVLAVSCVAATAGHLCHRPPPLVLLVARVRKGASPTALRTLADCQRGPVGLHGAASS